MLLVYILALDEFNHQSSIYHYLVFIHMRVVIYGICVSEV